MLLTSDFAAEHAAVRFKSVSLKSEGLQLRSWTSVRGGSGKHLPAIRQRHFRAIGHFRSILGAIAGDRDLIARFQGIQLPPCPPQNQRRAEFDIPIRHVAAFILHVYIETGMRVHPLDFCDDSRELYRTVLVILSCKRMMSERRPGQHPQTQAGEQETDRNSSHLDLHVYLPVICSASWLFSLQMYSQISSPGARSATCFTFQAFVKVPVSS